MENWRLIQQKSIRRSEELERYFKLAPGSLPQTHFPLLLPLRLASKINPDDPNDPILRQFVPSKEEGLPKEGFVAQPTNDETFKRSGRLLHKYQGRALLVTTGACAMHCRYCFRQNYAYSEAPSSFDSDLALIEEDRSLQEIILSGGDPLSRSDRALRELLERLDGIAHVQRIRFHTRFPIGIPERITEDFLKLLGERRAQIWFVIHCNHPRELDEDVLAALARIQKLGIPVLNQAVLLKGVNDTASILAELCERLADRGILPYYLHQLDRVEGAAHFEVPVEHGRELVTQVAERLSGYAVPHYVQEIPGQPRKTPLI